MNLDFDSAVAEHAVMENHLIDWDNCNILANDGTRNTRWIRESIWIRRKSNKDMHRHLMNGDEGAYRLSHLYDQLIQNTSSSTSSDVTSKPASSGLAGSALIHY